MCADSAQTIGARVRWGVLGTGRMAFSFAGAFPQVPAAQFVAVASRRREKAESFAGRVGASNIAACEGLDELLARDDIDAVYVATPHALHAAQAEACLLAGKHVLVEKAFTLNAAEAERVVSVAANQKRFLMEAMWIRFLPGFAAFMDAVRSGVIGEPRWLQASFCFAQPPDPRSPRFDPKLGGGALLDVGVYPLALSRALFGDPRELQVTARKDASPVELEVHALLSYTNGCTAMLAAAIGLKTPCEALLCGTHGMIRVDEPWPFFRRMSVWQYENASDLDAGRALRPWQNLTRLAARLPTDPLAAASCICRQAGMLLRRKQAVARLIGHRGNPYRFELEHTTRCIQQRHTESPMWPHDDTLGLMRLLDRVRTAASRPMIAPQPSD